MKCWFCDKDAKGTCAACGRGLCAIMLISTMSYAREIRHEHRLRGFYNVYNALNVRTVVWNGSTIG